MVHLNRIYTRTGDGGQTSLGDGTRVPKSSLRVEAYGTVDEANAAIGLTIVLSRSASAAGAGGAAGSLEAEILQLLERIQNDLFDVGADLCTPVSAGEAEGARLRITEAQTQSLERAIDRYNADLPALTSFVLPGGTVLAANLHVARTVVRRAERLIAELTTREPDGIGEEVLRYVNRLSDLLFVLARAANANAGGDVLWQPGQNRSG